MYLVALAWIYVALMMSVVEATSTTGTVLGALITFVLYGAAPVALLMYLLGTPGRRRAVKAREQAEFEAWKARQAATMAAGQVPAVGTRSDAPDAGGEAPAATPGGGVAPVRKEP